MKEIKCPNCGAPMEVIEDKEYQFCQFCGTRIEMANRPETISEAAVKITDKFLKHRASEKEKKRIEEEKQRKEAGKVIIGFSIMMALCILMLMIETYFSSH